MYQFLLVAVLAISTLSAATIAGRAAAPLQCTVPPGGIGFRETWKMDSVSLWRREYPYESDDWDESDATLATPVPAGVPVNVVLLCLNGQGELRRSDIDTDWPGPNRFYVLEGSLAVQVFGENGVARFIDTRGVPIPTADDPSGNIPRDELQTIGETEAFYVSGVEMELKNRSDEPAIFLVEQVGGSGPPGCASRCL
jgi:hypothetical protein